MKIKQISPQANFSRSLFRIQFSLQITHRIVLIKIINIKQLATLRQKRCVLFAIDSRVHRIDVLLHIILERRAHQARFKRTLEGPQSRVYGIDVSFHTTSLRKAPRTRWM